ncbi:MAG: outer membrane beta-barrel protein [Ekhidna sp.]|nr:outer membrane beta-barrel protein [Ekhidna sp.]
MEFAPQLGVIMDHGGYAGRNTNFSVGFGIGYEVSSQIALGTRYNAGLSNLSIAEEDDDFSNNTLSINVFYAL